MAAQDAARDAAASLHADLVTAQEQQDVLGEVSALTRCLDVPGLDDDVERRLVARRGQLYVALRNPVGARRDLRRLVAQPGEHPPRAEILRGLAVIDDHLLHRPRRAAETYREAAQAFATAGNQGAAVDCTAAAEAATARAADPAAARDWMRHRRARLAVDVLGQEALRLGQVSRVVDLGGGRSEDLSAVPLRQAFPGAEHVSVDLLPLPERPAGAGVRHVQADLGEPGSLPSLRADLVHSSGLVHFLADRLHVLATHVHDALAPGGSAVVQFNVDARLGARSGGRLGPDRPLPPVAVADALFDAGLQSWGWHVPLHLDGTRRVRQELHAWWLHLDEEDAAALAWDEDVQDQYLLLGLVVARRPA